MSFRKNFGRKQIGDKNYLDPQMITLSAVKDIEVVDNTIKVVTQPSYTVTEENLILVKNVDNSVITINENSIDYITIKSLTNVTIKPTDSKIDEYYDELSIGKGACVELQRIQNGWYIISSDGIKLG